VNGLKATGVDDPRTRGIDFSLKTYQATYCQMLLDLDLPSIHWLYADIRIDFVDQSPVESTVLLMSKNLLGFFTKAS
jgi:hypothetical protein